jgi:hypothetical protein
LLALLLLAALAAACASGFDRRGVDDRMASGGLAVTNEDVRAALAVKPQLPAPFRIAVHLVAETFEPGAGPVPASPDLWRWTAKDKALFEEWTRELRARGVAAEMFAMTELIPAGDDLAGLRLAAAKHGADAVLLLKGVAQVDAYVNPLAVFNLLILPAFFVPASHRDALVVIRAALFDVRNEYLYAAVEAEGEGSSIGPSALIGESGAIEEAKEEALADFGPELVDRIARLKTR